MAILSRCRHNGSGERWPGVYRHTGSQVAGKGLWCFCDLHEHRLSDWTSAWNDAGTIMFLCINRTRVRCSIGCGTHPDQSVPVRYRDGRFPIFRRRCERGNKHHSDFMSDEIRCRPFSRCRNARFRDGHPDIGVVRLPDGCFSAKRVCSNNDITERRTRIGGRPHEPDDV